MRLAVGVHDGLSLALLGDDAANPVDVCDTGGVGVWGLPAIAVGVGVIAREIGRAILGDRAGAERGKKDCRE